VLAQLVCEVTVLRTIPRGVFYPVPNVDSALVLLRRVNGDPVSPALRALVSAGFAHRRKTFAGALALAGDASPLPPRPRQQVQQALLELGHPADVRAERLTPDDFRALARLLEL
jgi:16S rRNA (adenine1518-N6/adenine1519-N6)-dimethyltransferase